MGHISVLLQETLDGLDIEKGDTLLDGTFNDGGHSIEAARRVSGDIHIIGIDLDSDALEKAQKRFDEAGYAASLYNENFRNLDRVLEKEGLESVTKIILDLGFSSVQLEESGRGFSFRRDEPLIMTLSKESSGLNAHTIVNEWDPEHIESIIKYYGEEPRYRRVVKAIVEAREEGEIKTTSELASIIESVLRRGGRIHPATKTFQALRIAVNDEIEALREGLEKGFSHLSSGGRIAIISFHSIEDRIVKRFFKEKVQTGEAEFIIKKPITASDVELENNPRSRSAKLRIIRKN